MKKAIAKLFGILFISSFSMIQAEPQLENESKTELLNVVEKPAINVIGIECRTSNKDGEALRDIPLLWKKFKTELTLCQIPHKISNEVVALYCDYEGDHTQPYSLVLGCQVSSLDDIPDGMVAKTIPAGSYAVFKVEGEYPQSLIATWTSIWKNSGLDRTYTGDYELYGNKFFEGPTKELEVFIAIKP